MTTSHIPIGFAAAALVAALTAGHVSAAVEQEVFFSGGIINRASGKALDVTNKSLEDGANIQQWEFAGAANQMWDVVDQGNGRYSIINRLSRKALDVTDRNSADGANIQQYRFEKAANQLWRLEASGTYYRIVSVATGKCLDVNLPQIKDNGANVQQWTCSTAANQQWRFADK